MPLPDDEDLRAQGEPEKYLVYAKVRAPNGSILEVLVEMDQEKGRELFLKLSAESLMHGRPVDPPGMLRQSSLAGPAPAVGVISTSGPDGVIGLAAAPGQDLKVGDVVGVDPGGNAVKVKM